MSNDPCSYIEDTPGVAAFDISWDNNMGAKDELMLDTATNYFY
jgi:hypothetical protein